MNVLIKTLAACAPALILATPAFASGKYLGCTINKDSGWAVKHVEYMRDGKPVIDSTFWEVRPGVSFTSCKEAEASLVSKPKEEVKVLGGRPIVPDPQNTIKRAEYCNGGVIHSFSVVLGKIMDVTYSGACRLDSSKTVTLTGL